MKKFSWKHLNSKIKLISATIVILMLVQMLVLIIVSNNRQTELFNSQASEAFSNNIVSMDEMLDYLKETTIAFSKQQNVYHLFFANHISRQDMQSFKLATGLIPNKVSSSIKNVYIFNEATNSIYANNMSVTHIDKLPESTTKSIICSGSSNGGKMKLFVDKEVFLVDAEMKHPEQMLRICYFPSKQLSSCIVMDVSISDLTALYDTYRKAFTSEVFITSKNELSYGTGGPALQEAIKSQLSQLSNRDYRYPVFHNLQGTEYLVLKKKLRQLSF